MKKPKIYYLGLTDRASEGDWMWLDGTPALLPTPSTGSKSMFVFFRRASSFSDSPTNMQTHASTKLSKVIWHDKQL